MRKIILPSVMQIKVRHTLTLSLVQIIQQYKSHLLQRQPTLILRKTLYQVLLRWQTNFLRLVRYFRRIVFRKKMSQISSQMTSLENIKKLIRKMLSGINQKIIFQNQLKRKKKQMNLMQYQINSMRRLKMAQRESQFKQMKRVKSSIGRSQNLIEKKYGVNMSMYIRT